MSIVPRNLMLGGDLPVNRLGFGAMRLTDNHNWQPLADRSHAIKVARHAVELGVNFIDTADSYGLGANEELLAEALHPYPDHLIIATKAGQSRPSPTEWKPLGRPEYLRQQAELSLRRLRVDRIDLFQLHRIDPQVPLADQIGALKQLQGEGKIRHIGLSEVTVAQLEQARGIAEIASVQNLYNLTDRRHESVLHHCAANQIAFIPWLPIARGDHTHPNGPIAVIAHEVGATPAQAALAWLLHSSPATLPIPGTSSLTHLKENVAAVDVKLSDDHLRSLSQLATRMGS